MTNDELKILEAFRQGEQAGKDFILVIQHERLETGGGLTLVKKACPTRIYEISKPLYDFAITVQRLLPQRATLFLLDVSENLIQIFDIRPNG